MKHQSLIIILALMPLALWAQGTADAALATINRFTRGTMPVQVHLTLSADSVMGDRFVYTLSGDTLVVYASSPVAACRGFYHWTKSKGAGISSWSGSRFVRPADLATPTTAMCSPYRDHPYFNVVTYGYTMPYWGQQEWDRELDWMALHGIDMPLMLLGQESVYREVFRDMGLSDAEVDQWLVGPAHLPWMRMGNLAGNSFNGPLGRDWERSNRQLAQYVIQRMRQLGMKPICPAFGGFVPRALADHYDVQLDTTGWDWMPAHHRNYRVRPDSPLFVEIGSRFIRKWDSIFGPGHYYLSDSFNEMSIPQDTALISRYGQAVYSSIRQANPQAVWAMQGWSLGYQRWQWGGGIFQSLLRHVPQDKFYLLDMATDYNCCFWHNTFDWEYYDGFYGRPWAWSVIPNMGGKTAYTGVLDYYANGRIQAQLSPNRGRLLGYGMAPEGLDNNEVVYELLCDGGYMGPTDSIHVAQWLSDYTRCRYGRNIPLVDHYWQQLYQSVYSSFHDHPQFGWQVRNNIVGRGSANTDSVFCRAVEHLFASPAVLDSILRSLDSVGAQLLLADIIEGAAQYLAHSVEQASLAIGQSLDRADTAAALHLLSQAEQTLYHLDAILDHHPLHRLDRWLAYPMQQPGIGPDERQRNRENALRLVTVWYGQHQADEPVNDYSCRLWSGLVRDYYLPRFRGTWLRRILGTPFDQIAFENRFLHQPPSPVLPISSSDLIPFISREIRRGV